MSLSNVTFVKGQNGLGRPLSGQDYISALIFYSNTLPSGFTSQNNIRQFFQALDAQNAGILNDYSDATPATATILITANGATGDVVTITVKDIDSDGDYPTDDNGNQLGPTVICAYTLQASDNTISLIGGSLAAAINANTLTNGYSASFNNGTETLTIQAPKKFGVFLNTGSPLALTVNQGSAFTGNITQFSGGIASTLAFYYYHISEFFRIQPQGQLFVGFFPVPGTYNFNEVATIQNFSKGIIRQVAVYKDFASAFTVGDLQALTNTIVASCDSVHKPLSGLYAADMTGIASVANLTDLSTLTANKSSAIIGQDGGGTGNFLYKTLNKSISCLGAALGCVALSKVSNSIGWIGSFNMSNGSELEEIAFANGQQFSSAAISDNLLNLLDNERYVFLRKVVGLDGSYFNAGNTAIAASSDYAYIEDNRTIDKAIRGVYANILPYLNGPITLNPDGTLTDEQVATLESGAAPNLDAMVKAGELSDYSVVINPVQYVLTTGVLAISIELLQQGVARQITVNIGFVPKIS